MAHSIFHLLFSWSSEHDCISSKHTAPPLSQKADHRLLLSDTLWVIYYHFPFIMPSKISAYPATPQTLADEASASQLPLGGAGLKRTRQSSAEGTPVSHPMRPIMHHPQVRVWKEWDGLEQMEPGAWSQPPHHMRPTCQGLKQTRHSSADGVPVYDPTHPTMHNPHVADELDSTVQMDDR